MSAEKQPKEKINYFRPAKAIIPIITPAIEIAGETKVDTDSILGMVNWALTGADIFFLLGSTGEGANIPLMEKVSALDAFMKAVDGRKPVLVNISGTNVEEIVNIADLAASFGIDGFVLSPLFGDGDPHEKVDAITQRYPIPLTIYNNPKIQDGRSLDPEFIDWVVHQPEVVGVKDSSGKQEVFDLWLSHKSPDFHVLQGSSKLLDFSLQNRADGYVLQSMNLCPADHAWNVLMPNGIIDREAVERSVRIRDQAKGTPEIKQLLFQMGLIRSPVTFKK